MEGRVYARNYLLIKQNHKRGTYMKNTIKTIGVIVFTAVIGFSMAGCDGTDSPATNGVRVFSMACNHANNSTFPTTLGNRAFIEYINRETNGHIIIELAARGLEEDTLQATKNGTIAFNRLPVITLASDYTNIGALAMPFIYRDREHKLNVLDGPIGDAALGMLTGQNLLGLAWYDAGFRNFYSTSPIRTVGDMYGMSIRIMNTPLMREMINLLGAEYDTRSFGQVYYALRDDYIHGAENNWPSFVQGNHYRVASYITLSGHIASPEMLLVNTGVWNSFSAAEQDIIRSAAQYAAAVQRAEWLVSEKAAMERAYSYVEIIELEADARQAFVTAMAPLFETYGLFAQYATTIGAIRAVQ